MSSGGIQMETYMHHGLDNIPLTVEESGRKRILYRL